MKPTLTARLAALLLFSLSPGTGGTLTLFGPQNYVREEGSPREVTRTFSVANPSGTYTLHIDNGGTSHQGTMVSSATVQLNDVQVVSSSDFGRNALTIDKTVTLRSANRLTVELHGQPGGAITLYIVGKENAVPIITAVVTPTPNGAGWNNTNLTVSFKCSDPGGAIASCSQPVGVQTETDGKTITGTAVDSNKNSATAKVTVKLDKTLPTVTSSVSPTPNASGWNNSNATVTFRASDALSGVASVTGPATVSTEGSSQTVSGTAVDGAGNSRTVSATVKLDKTAPVLTVGSPVTESLRLIDFVTIEGTVVDSLSGVAKVTCNGFPATISGNGFSCTVILVFGASSITVAGTDQAGNTASSVVKVAGGSIIVNVSPATATLYGGQTQQFTASMTNANNTAVNWTATAGTISPTGLYTAPASITAQQSVTVTATSQADGTKSDSATVTLRPPVAVSVSPATVTLTGGQTRQFTAAVTNAGNTAVTWSIPAGSPGTISATGLYTAPAMIASGQTVTVTATSQADSTKSATAAVTLSPPVSVTVAPGSMTLSGGQTQQFTATVSNAGNTAVTWTISPATGAGAISGSGLYTAPANIAAPQTVTITATSQADSTKQATGTVTLSPAVSITVVPGSMTLSGGQTQQFTATVSNAANTSVSWSVNPAAGAGTISGSGLYTAPASIAAPATVTITATSQADSTKHATGTVTLSPAVSITMAPGSMTLSGGQTQQFTATVSNAGNTAVTWTISPATGAGAISGSGLYTAPASIAAPQTVAITATSQADPTKQATATVTLSPPPVSVSVNPPAGTLSAGQAMQLTAGVQNTPNTAVTWSISPAGAGAISPSGYYTAPIYIGSQVTATLTATSVADPTRFASAAVTLLPGSFAPIRVNAGGPAYIDPQGVLWNASNGFTSVPSGVPSPFFFSPPAGSNIPLIYQSGLYSNSAPIQYRAEVPNGQYLVTLKFADPIIEFDIFDVNINGVKVLPQTNVYAAVGQYHPWDATVPVNVTDGQITIVFTAVSWYAVINAIEIVAANSVEVLAHDPALALQQTMQFTARVRGAGSQAVTWSIQPSIGTISSTGLYTAPSTLAVPAAVTVTATSVENPSLAGTSVISLNPVSASAIVPVRVNAGGPAYTDPQGAVWSASNGFSSLPSGVPSPFAFTPPAGSNISPIYQTGLLSNSAPIQYQADVPNGQYLVTLKFADSIIEFDTFDVSINGVAVLSHLNVYATAGQYQPWDATVPVNVTNGQITIVFSPVSWNAVINAIQIVPTGVM